MTQQTPPSAVPAHRTTPQTGAVEPAANPAASPAVGIVNLSSGRPRQEPPHGDRRPVDRVAPHSELRRRSILKAVVWRLLASLTTMGLVFLFTHETKTAFWVGIIEVAAKMTLYYGHERLWNHIRWGRLGLAPADSNTAGQPA